MTTTRRRRRPLAAIGLAVALGALAGCADGAEPTTTASPETDPVPGDEEPEATADEADDDEATDASSGCAEAAADLAPDDATASFPDNPDAVWSVTGESTDDDGRAVVEVVPEGDDVGYPAFRFVFRCDGDTPVHVGTYASEDGAWVLLFTTDELGTDELAPVLP